MSATHEHIASARTVQAAVVAAGSTLSGDTRPLSSPACSSSLVDDSSRGSSSVASPTKSVSEASSLIPARWDGRTLDLSVGTEPRPDSPTAISAPATSDET